MINNLNPNTQYIVYVQAETKKGVSMPSETLIAWTDPAYPAFVEVSCLSCPSFILFHIVIILTAPNCSSNQPSHRRKQYDSLVHCYGYPNAYHILVHIR